jgi:wyosine [tRNA(Phe)-imidazoG37] synthetase (radical SAM superfamily)
VAEAPIQINSSLAAVRDHSRQYADFTFVYPVISRRSGGLSIGINLNPDKVCNFDCIYCEVDRRVPGKVSEVDLNQLRDELTALIRSAKDGGLAQEPKFKQVPELTRTIRDLSFSGDGEPTLLANFSECAHLVAEVKRVERLHETRIVLITDAAGLDKADVRRGLEIMDANHGEVWGKLDAGTEEYFRLVNRTSVRFERILKNLTETARARPIVIQTLLLRVRGDPMPPPELDAYCDRLNGIVSAGGRIREVHLYTLARPAPEPYAGKLEPGELAAMRERVWESTHLKVSSFD